jgi:O-glycosyl hydrolase
MKAGRAVLQLITWLLVLLLVSPAAADSGRVVPRPAQTFRGWGMSLAWEANDLYGGGRQPAQIKDPNIQGQYMDLLYGDPITRLTLGFTVARYNIGGGDDPSHTHMRPDAQMDGFQFGPGAPFDWTRDAAQRRMLHEAKKRGANLFEAFSVSPPYWMTVSGCASGSKSRQHEDNLQPAMVESFVQYLTTVVKYFRDVEGVHFESLEPFNEPDLGWGAGGRQEGYSASPSIRNTVIPMLARRLKQDGIDTLVSGIDTNNVAAAVGSVEQLEPSALGALGRFNTHDYHAASYWVRLKRLKELGQKFHKPIWMSEVGCCFPAQGDKTDMWGALFMADTIRADLRDMGAVVWVLWQPDWNVIAFDPQGGAPHLKKQFFALAQYTRFIRPGYEIISAGGAYNTLAAYSPQSKRLVLVTTNWDADTPIDLDLSAFGSLPPQVSVYRTTSDEAVNLQQGTIGLSSAARLFDQLPARSVTTYVIDGVAPRSAAPSSTIEGTHQIVSEGTKLCLNINQNSTRSGEGIIPYPCGGFNNMEFNFVDQRNGLYAIETVNGPNGAKGLCLNISTASSSPGDGKKLGGPGNLIQWGCSNRPPFDNELFAVSDAGRGRVRIRVKSSGLCIEDPGRGGTIRQNICKPSELSQQFTLAD